MRAARDLRYTLRVIRRNPGYALTATLCLGLGIGVNTTVYTWLDEMYFRRLPVPEADRVIAVYRGDGPPCSWREYKDFAPGLRSVSTIAAIIPKGTFLDIDKVNAQIYAEVVSANYFDVLRVPPALGRAFQPSEDQPASDPVAVISERVWTRHFHRDPQAIGKSVRIEDQWYRIVGIAPAGFQGASAPLAVDAWVPVATYPHYRRQLIASSSAAGPDVFLLGRLVKSRSLSDAAAEFQVVDSRMRREEPRNPRLQNRIAVRGVAGYMWMPIERAARPAATLLSAVVAVILLIACVNVANLLLSRAAVRRREMAARRALGAGFAQLVRQGLTEGLVLALGGAALGILFGLAASRILRSLLPAAHPDLAGYIIHFDVNWRVAMFTALASIVCALLFSIAPALENARCDITAVLKGASGGDANGRGSRRRDYLVIVQVGLSLVLLVSATLLIRSLREAQSADPGFATEKRSYVRLFTPNRDFTPQQATNLFSRLLDEARALPGVQAATLSFAVFGFMDGDCASSSMNEPPRKLNLNVVEPDYFRFMRTPLLRGRTFDAGDRPESARVIVINETMARRWWPGQDPIGRTAWLGCPPETRIPAEVIGIVRDSKYGSLDEGPRPFYFAHWRQVWWDGFFALMVASAGDPRAAEGPLLKLAQTGGPNLRIYEFRTFDDLISLSLFRVRWQAALLMSFSVLAILLAAVGLYGVVAYTTAQRTREIGIRMALGAAARDVKWMVLRHSLSLTVRGLLLGLLASAAVTRLLSRFLYGVSPLDPLAFAASALSWILISTIAGYIPSRRASSIDPLVALRYE
jgi:putative ABC transport system permease protein